MLKRFHKIYDIHCMKAGTSLMKNHVFDKEQFGIEDKVSVTASFDMKFFYTQDTPLRIYHFERKRVGNVFKLA